MEKNKPQPGLKKRYKEIEENRQEIESNGGECLRDRLS